MLTSQDKQNLDECKFATNADAGYKTAKQQNNGKSTHVYQIGMK